jgi:acetyl esterase/lipase
VASNRIVFIGDSAGGGLTLLTLLALQDEDKGTLFSAFHITLWERGEAGCKGNN